MKVYLSICLLFASCNGTPQTTQSIRPVKSCIVEKSEYIDKDFAGLSTADDAANLAFKVAGQILDIAVSDGQRVEKGELLARLEPRDFELQVSADRSAFEQSTSKLERIKRLLEREAVSRQEFENAKTTYDQALSVYENSKELLKQTKLLAPFAAVVEATYADTYERVQSGQAIVRIVKPLSTTVGFTIPESSLKLLSLPTTRFEVEFDNYRGVIFDAKIDSYASTTSDASGFPVSLTIENPNPKLYPIAPGYTCVITMQVLDASSDAYTIPLSAIYAPSQGGTYVWIIKSNHIEKVPVVLGELYGVDRVIVESGIVGGERVVTAGVYQLKEGEEVKIISK